MTITHIADPVAVSLQRTSDFYALNPRVDAADCQHEETGELFPYDPRYAGFLQCCDCDDVLTAEGETTRDPRPAQAVAA